MKFNLLFSSLIFLLGFVFLKESAALSVSDELSKGPVDDKIRLMLQHLDNMIRETESLTERGNDYNPDSSGQISRFLGETFDLVFEIIGMFNPGVSNEEIMEAIKQGFAQLNQRMDAFDKKLTLIYQALSAQINLALYHPTRVNIHLLFDEFKATMQSPQSVQINRFKEKCIQYDPYDNLFRLKMLAQDQVSSSLFPSLTRLMNFERKRFIPFKRIFASDASIAAILTGACTSFRQLPWSPIGDRTKQTHTETLGIIRDFIMNWFNINHGEFRENLQRQLNEQLQATSMAGTPDIARHIANYVRDRYTVHNYKWTTFVFNTNIPSHRHHFKNLRTALLAWHNNKWVALMWTVFGGSDPNWVQQTTDGINRWDANIWCGNCNGIPAVMITALTEPHVDPAASIITVSINGQPAVDCQDQNAARAAWVFPRMARCISNGCIDWWMVFVLRGD